MSEVIHGDGNGNQLNARADKTQVYGLKGNDTLTSDDKRDILLIGGSGDDSLIMSGGNGTLSGGDGSDTFELTYSATKPLSAVIEDLEPSKDKIVVNFDGDTAPQLSSVTSGNDVIFRDGERLNVTLKGVRDNDYFDGDASNEAWKVLELTNVEREAEGKSPLTMADGLTAGAEIRVQEITDLGASGQLDIYKHTRPENKGYYDTVLEGKYIYPGENLDGGARSPAQVLQDWMSSDAHKENILRDNFQKLGVGYNENDADPSNQRFYWVQLFADSLKAQTTVDVSNASPQTNAVSKFIQGDDSPNTISNGEYGVTIDARGGGDSVTNSGLLASVSGGDGDDTLNNSGNFSTINGGLGDDRISLNASTKENVIEYASGDGSDTVSGLNATDTVTVSGDEFTPEIIGNDIIVTVGADAITLVDAARGGVQLLGSRSKIIILTDNADSLKNTIDGATLQAKGGDDSIENYSGNVTIDGGDDKDRIINSGATVSIFGDAGDDSIDNLSANVTIDGGKGTDSIYNRGTSVSIRGNTGNDRISNIASDVTITAGEGNDSISNVGSFDNFVIYSEFVSIDGGDGNDSIQNQSANVSINGNVGNDIVYNLASDVTITAGEGNDTIANFASFVTIDGGTGNDSIRNRGASVSISGGTGNDYIESESISTNVTIDGGAGEDSLVNAAANVTINAGANRDTIILTATAQNNLLIYNAGDGSDFIFGLNETSTLRIGDGTGSYSTQQSGSHLLVQVDDATITLFDAANVVFKIEGTESEGGSDTTPADDHIILSQGGDTYRNNLDVVMIEAVDGNDYYIVNEGAYVFVSGADGKDYIDNIAMNVIIYGNGGDDFLSNQGTDATIVSGEGNDSVCNEGLNTAILGLEGDDSITNSGNSVTIDSGASNDTIQNDGSNVTLMGGADNDTIRNRAENVTIYGGEDDDTISNDASNVLIRGGTGDDLISLESDAKNNVILYNEGEGSDMVVGFNNDDTLSVLGNYMKETVGNDVRVSVGAGVVVLNGAASLDAINIVSRNEDGTFELPLDINNSTSNTLITGTAYGDKISNSGNYVTIQALGGNDDVFNYGSSKVASIYSFLGGTDGDYASVDTGAGDDTVRNDALNVTIAAGAGNDSVYNEGNGAVISGGDGKDYIDNIANNVSIISGAGDDQIDNSGSNVTILGGANNDTINNSSANVTINAGTGDDRISLSGDGAGSFIQYTPGDGNDTIWGLTENSRLQIGDGTGTYSIDDSIASGDDIIIRVGNGSIRLVNFRDNPEHVIIGESGTSGGGSDSGGDDGSNDNSSGGSGGNTSGGTSASEGNTGAASGGGRSASGSSGNTDSSGRGNGGNFRVIRNNHSTTANAPTVTAPTATPQQTPSPQQTSTTTTTTANQRVYTGGNQVISDYASGERITFGATYTGAFYDGNGNFFAGSTTGALVVQNAVDKVVDLGDAAGNDFVKAYAATTAGVIDGRGLAGFEIINGSAGSDAIYAGDGGSQLWGGADTVSDAMLGGNGTDIFIGGKNQGADFFLNASSADIVHLNDSTLSDIVATAEENGTIGIAFNTGNVVAVQSSETLSATVMLADGSAYRYNHANKSWQTA